MPAWNKEEIKCLEENYGKLTYKEIGKILGRAWTSVRNKANSLNLMNTERDKKKEHSLYQSWKSMNVRHKDFVLWKDYEEFYDWGIKFWKKGLVLTRKDKEKEYGPDNCIFVKTGDISSQNSNPEKAKQTSIEQYGVEHYNKTQEYKDKTKLTCLEKYGVEHQTQAKVVKDKIKKTVREKYGYDSVLSCPEIKKKIVKTNIEKYGVPYPTLNKEIRQKQIDTLISKYGKVFNNGVVGNKEELEIKKEIEQISKLEFNSTYKILDGKEIDLYNDKLKIGIEYCGLFWHTEHSKECRDKNYHFDKYKKCREKNIRLITIFSDEWIYRKKQVKGFLRSVLGGNTTIYGRKCEVKETCPNLARTFINDNHIQKIYQKPKLSIGIYYNNNLYGIMTINTHHRNSQTLCLNRLCFKSGYTVIGGTQKMWKFFLLNKKPSEVITWSDNRWSNGEIYSMLGFKKDGDLPPDYSYVNMCNPKKRRSKQSSKKKYINCKENQTEYDRMIELGYSRIWDCGKIRWLYN